MGFPIEILGESCRGKLWGAPLILKAPFSKEASLKGVLSLGAYRAALKVQVQKPWGVQRQEARAADAPAQSRVLQAA